MKKIVDNKIITTQTKECKKSFLKWNHMTALLLLEKLPLLIFNNLLSAHQQHTIPIIALVIHQYLHAFI
jgi:hypothetical protein